MIRRLLIYAVISIALPAVSADNIRWLSTEYDFGSFREAEGKKTGFVQFVNDGTEPTIINRVKPTCGCTVAKYTEGEIAPGDTATVSFTYNPAGRPGRFLKHIKVYTGLDNALTSVTIKGTVIGAPQTLAQEYPIVAGAARFTTDTLNMGHIKFGIGRNEFIHGYNLSADTLSISWKDVPKNVSLGVSSRAIAPGDIFTLSVFITSTQTLELGENTLTFTLCAADANGNTAELPFTVKAYIDSDFSHLSPEDMKKAPVANLYPTLADLGTVTEADKKIKLKFALKNDGKSVLEVKRIYSPQIQLTKSTDTPFKLKPGKEKQIEIEVDARLIPAGLFNIPIEVLTNDPMHPSRSFRIVGTRK